MRIVSCVGIGLLGLVVGCSNAPKEPLYTPAKVGDGLKFAEGPAWDGKGNLYVSNCSADPGYVTKFDEKGHAAVAFTASDKTFKKTNGIANKRNSRFFLPARVV